MTIGGRSAAAEVTKSAPLSAAAAIEAIPNGFMIAGDGWLSRCGFYNERIVFGV